MKILVTGSSGFIGDYVVKELLHLGHSIVATSSNVENLKNKTWFDKVEAVEFNLHTKSSSNLFEIFKKPDMLIHLAWQGLPNYDALYHIESIPFHYNFLKNLVENGLKKVLITGTCFEYGLQEGCLSEDMPTSPINSYALAKDTLRKFVEELSKNYDFTYNWIRLFYMYGENQSPKSLLSLLEKAIEAKETRFNMSGGEQLRDYLKVEEVAKNLVNLALNLNKNDIINCCSGKPISIRKLVEEYLENKNLNIKLNLGYYPYNKHEPMAFWGDDKKLKNYVQEDKNDKLSSL